MNNLMSTWKELLDLMQGLPRASDAYNQVVGDAVVAVDRGIKELEAELTSLKKLAGEYIREYEKFAFESGLYDLKKDVTTLEDEVIQLEDAVDDLLTKLVAGEELYISRGIRIANLEVELMRLKIIAKTYLDNPKLGARDNLEDALKEGE